ncbi:11339_t:CDS:2 [Ambispora gerdemannii]|uniref:11339_t:CDS:1 n=1 Tax=Ambispora gerdemannii TaxID=144530 RepID=A0A9N9ACN7_9GLOM|nr:11339_t:CDS:2 [Ambispora gerdemannii]
MTGLQRVFPAFDIDGRPINIQYHTYFRQKLYGGWSYSQSTLGDLAFCLAVRPHPNSKELSPPPVQIMETGQTLQLEASLTSSEAELFEWLHLELGKGCRRSTAGFHPNILRVTNHRTSASSSLWDISQMRHLDFLRSILTLFLNMPTTLMRELIAKSMNKFEYGNDAQKVTARNGNYVLKDQVYAATNMNVLLFAHLL